MEEGGGGKYKKREGGGGRGEKKEGRYGKAGGEGKAGHRKSGTAE
jgi:hypothetical protein